MNFGGPVWHASAATQLGDAVAWAMTEQALSGVGDATLGEWREPGNKAVHLRRRLSIEEQGDLTVRDIRGSEEEHDRRAILLREAPQLKPMLAAAGFMLP